jgi:probable addiction module antidote protein
MKREQAMTNNKASVSFDETSRELLSGSESAALYLEECLEEGDTELFKLALKHVADAQIGGMTKLSKTTDLTCEALYRSLSRQGNPGLETLTKVLQSYPNPEVMKCLQNGRSPYTVLR